MSTGTKVETEQAPAGGVQDILIESLQKTDMNFERCDQCGQRAYVLTLLPPTEVQAVRTLTWCGHHYEANKTTGKIGVIAKDIRSILVVRETEAHS